MPVDDFGVPKLGPALNPSALDPAVLATLAVPPAVARGRPAPKLVPGCDVACGVTPNENPAAAGCWEVTGCDVACEVAPKLNPPPGVTCCVPATDVCGATPKLNPPPGVTCGAPAAGACCVAPKLKPPAADPWDVPGCAANCGAAPKLKPPAAGA